MPAMNKKATAASSSVAAQDPPSKKRKMDSSGSEQKYYAVRAGHKPGVYTSWAICQQQISGFKGAQFKSFLSYEDASAFAAGREPASSAAGDKPVRFYGVAVGRQPGVYTDWAKAQETILGWKGPKYKKFETRREAEDYVRSFGNTKVMLYEGNEAKEVEPPAKKIKKAAKGGVLDVPVVYTDGSSLGNGRDGATAGVGVFFGAGNARNISERLQGEVQTNQRAELTAILRALDIIGKDSPLEIRTDSKYSIQCVTEWYVNWEKGGWMSQNREPVKNQDLIKAIRAKLVEREAGGVPTQFTWVKGHANDPGNIAADALAVAGARLPL